ncbi:hypothetical protein LCGC14_3096670, partial [marine sediment metagenome]
ADIKITERYLGFFKSLNTQSKKELIIALTNSIDDKIPKQTNISDLYDAWDDERTAEEIIKDIKDSRIQSREIDGFE